MITKLCLYVFWVLCAFLALPAGAIPVAAQTERIYLSGKGPKDAVPWQFSVDGGRRAGEKTTLPVPSVWEQHGFGTYSYGNENEAREVGRYSRQFISDETWRGKRVRLVFEGVMTDAKVRVNGVLAGPVHQGAFYRFSYDITPLLKFGEANLLEVEVAKESANAATNRAERWADYWVFGGIFRPVWLEISPVESIRQVSIDARADGTITADIQFDGARSATRIEGEVLNESGSPIGTQASLGLPAGGAGRVKWSTEVTSPRLWTAETPNLYLLRLTLYRGEEAIHSVTTRFGFRTFVVRPGEGLFLNGQRILLKGVNRHSFRPDTARALDAEDSYDDVRLIKSMNMNAVRMSHYPPDPAFLEAADELGLYVLNELSGWQAAHDTANGRLLVREMVERDVNHPSILFWDNGNEGGWNRDLDGEFSLYDPQNRPVLHPWELHSDLDTKHYSDWADLTKRLSGANLLMPTEVLHSLYDGGAGAGLEDYWAAISGSPRGAGMFFWAFADEGVARSDRRGQIDNFSTFAPDGIVGPKHEKEGSYYTIRNIWSPVQIVAPLRFDGTLTVSNQYDFTSLSKIGLTWETLRFPAPDAKTVEALVLATGPIEGIDIPPKQSGLIRLPRSANWRVADAVRLTAKGTDGQAMWTWTWPVSRPTLPGVAKGVRPEVQHGTSGVRLEAGSVRVNFDQATGLLKTLTRGRHTYLLDNGPRLSYARPRSSAPAWLDLEAKAGTQVLKVPQMANLIDIDLAIAKSDSYAGFKLELTADGKAWKTIYDGTRRPGDGTVYNFAPQRVYALRFSEPRSDSGNLAGVKSVRLGFEAERFPSSSDAIKVTTGTSDGEAWLESRSSQIDFRWTLRADGSLKLDYSYNLSGPFIYHGITFDHPQDRIVSVRSLARGPYRVWQNRLRGPELGVREAKRSQDNPGQAIYPEFQGYFAGFRWARFQTEAGYWQVNSAFDDGYLRIGTPLLGHVNTSPDFPVGDLSFMSAIPAMGSKFVTPEKSGPSSLPSIASGTYHGSLVFSFSKD